VVPLPLHVKCVDQELNKNIKQEAVDGQVFNEIIDDQVFNGIIKETDHNNESQLFQTRYELNLHYSVILHF